MPIKITHLGGEKCVTGSCHLIETTPGAEGTVSILVDCGTAYGAGPQLPFDEFPVAPAAMDYLFFTHANITLRQQPPPYRHSGPRSGIQKTSRHAIPTHALDAGKFINRGQSRSRFKFSRLSSRTGSI